MSGRARGRARGRERAHQGNAAAPRPGPPGNRQRPPGGQALRPGPGPRPGQHAPSPGQCPRPADNQPGGSNGNGNGRRVASRGVRPQTGAESGPNRDVGPVAIPGADGAGDARDKRPRGWDVMPFTPVGVPRPAITQEEQHKFLIMISNHYKVQAMPQHSLFQYDIKFEPDVDDFSQRSALISQHRDLFPTHLFDGNSLYSPTRLRCEFTEVISERRTDGEKIKLKITHTAVVAVNSEVWVQIVNILFRRLLKTLSYVQVGRHYFDPKAQNSKKIMCAGHELLLWPGFLTSLLPLEAGLMLCAEIRFKVNYNKSVLDLIADVFKRTPESRKDDRWKNAEMEVVGATVLTTYNNRTYRISAIRWEVKPTDTFNKNGEDITFLQYFQQQYGITIENPDQPMLETLPRERDRRRGLSGRSLLVPELCSMTGMTDEMRDDKRLQGELKRHMLQSPRQREDALIRLRRGLASGPAQEICQQWGLEFEKHLLEVQGKQLPPEGVVGQGNQRLKSYPGDFRDGLKSMRAREPVGLRRWMVVASRRNTAELEDLLNGMKRVARNMGIELGEPEVRVIERDGPRYYVDELKCLRREDWQYILCLIPFNSKDRYDAIKRLLTLELTIPSQVVVAGTVRKGLSPITGIVVQMQAKLGAEVWALELPPPPNIGLMVCGMDVYHEKEQPSVVAFISSYNAGLTKYTGQSCFLGKRQEIVPDLAPMMTKALQYYNTMNRKLPVRIVMYRDGVGHSNHQKVLDIEVAKMREAFTSFGQDYQPKLTVITVNKRIHQRFWLNDKNKNNPPPGTVISEKVTRPALYDFFLISQSVRQGTVSPTLYNVILDEVSLKETMTQKLTYKLTHLYTNWPGTISVPTPCQHAHKLAYQVGENLKGDAPDELQGKLFFL